jgi:potassium-transporting ATPase potassium-binding subunit
VESAYTGRQPGGNMEGKEVRFGNPMTALFATITTDASCGAVIGMHDSFTPIGGLVPLFNIQTDEVIFGGVGAGLYSMLIYAVVAVFIGGLMVGRTPEYVGKKIEQKEVKMAIIAILATALCILGFTAISSVIPLAKNGYWNPPGPAIANLNNGGAHGFSEILYTYSSGAGNNGSAFAGINANTPWYNLTVGIDMLIARFFFIIPALAIAGSLAAKKLIPVTSGTLPTNGSLFVVLLIGTVLIVGALTYFPALSLGPIVEHFQMLNGKLF